MLTRLGSSSTAPSSFSSPTRDTLSQAPAAAHNTRSQSRRDASTRCHSPVLERERTRAAHGLMTQARASTMAIASTGTHFDHSFMPSSTAPTNSRRREMSPPFGYTDAPLVSSGAETVAAVRHAPEAHPSTVYSSKAPSATATGENDRWLDQLYSDAEPDLVMTTPLPGISGSLEYAWTSLPSTNTPTVVKTEPVSSFDPMSAYPFASTALDDFSVSRLPMLGANASPSLLQHRALTFDATLESPLDNGYDSPDGSSDFQTSPFDEFLQPPVNDYSTSLFDSSPLPSLAMSTATIKPERDGPLNDLFPDLSLSTATNSNEVAVESPPDLAFAPPLDCSNRAQSPSALVSEATDYYGATEADAEVEEDPSPESEDEEYVPGVDTTTGKRHSRKRKTPSRLLEDEGDDDDDLEAQSSKRRSAGHRAPPIVPVDAPIQPRIYKGESKTSRKVLPKAMAKSMAAHRNRQKSVAAGSAEAEEIDDVTRAMVDQRRQQNTIAARKSRERKAQHLAGLEEAVERLTEENQLLKQRLLDAGLPVD
ncbi:hypothetical protein ACM66B_002065 [Microbotryomycetes sp. NB124-2]